jgi:hypothetical protein
LGLQTKTRLICDVLQAGGFSIRCDLILENICLNINAVCFATKEIGGQLLFEDFTSALKVYLRFVFFLVFSKTFIKVSGHKPYAKFET